MRPIRAWRYVLAALIAAFAAPAAVGAAVGGIPVGPVKIYPALEVRETYNSNLLLSSSGEEDDFITRVSPSLRAVLPLGAFYIQLKSDADFVLYADHNDENHARFDVGASAGAEFAGGLGFTLADTFQREYQKSSAEFGSGEYYTLNQAYGRLSYAGNAFKLQFEYFNYLHRYDDTDDLDRVENTGAVSFFYHFLPKTSAIAEADVSAINYDQGGDNDNYVYQVRGGFSWEFTGKSVGEVRLGWQWKDYRESGGTEDFFVIGIQTRTDFSRYTNLKLDLARRSVESDYADNPYYLATILSAALTQRLTGKISAALKGHVGQDSFPNESVEGTAKRKRSDTVYGLDLSCGFDMLRWLSIDAGLAYEKRDSVFSRYDYDVFTITMGVKAAF